MELLGRELWLVLGEFRQCRTEPKTTDALSPTKIRWMSFFDAPAEISNASIILVNGTPTRLFQFDLARKM
jgi:hypothetical protein